MQANVTPKSFGKSAPYQNILDLGYFENESGENKFIKATEISSYGLYF